ISEHASFEVPAARIKNERAWIPPEQGYMSGYDVLEAGDGRPAPVLRVDLKSGEDRSSAITGLKRASRPGQRLYVHQGGIPKVQGGMGTAIVSTSSGVMTGHEARAAGVGGEVVAYVW
ncbi:MAG: 30S ribosomal protein S8, partial [Solirubrobacterales bacterium]